MCNNCINKGITITLPPSAAAEISELKLQVGALTQALVTQRRENQPYIKELEDKRDFYKENYEYMQRMYSPVGDALHKAVPLLERAKTMLEGHTKRYTALANDISNFLNSLDVSGAKNQNIAKWETEANTYRQIIEQILLQMEYGDYKQCIPSGFTAEVAAILNSKNIAIASHREGKALGIYIEQQTTAGGVTPESE